MREAAAALALAVDGDGHSSREKRRAFVELGKWAATASDEELRAVHLAPRIVLAMNGPFGLRAEDAEGGEKKRPMDPALLRSCDEMVGLRGPSLAEVAEAGRQVPPILRRPGPVGSGQFSDAAEATAADAREKLASRMSATVGIVKRQRKAHGLPGLVQSGKLDMELALACDKMALSLDLTSLNPKTSKAYWEHARSLVEYFEFRGWDPKKWTFEHVGSWCCLYVCHGRKASNLTSIRCAWTHCAKSSDFEFTKEDDAKIRRLVLALIRVTDQGDRRFAWPWLYEMTFKAAETWGQTRELKKLRFLAATSMRGGTGMRGSTSFTSRSRAKQRMFNLTKSSVVWNEESRPRRLTVCVPDGKGAARDVTFAENIRNPYSTYALIRRWYESSSMSAAPADAAFFGRIRSDGTVNWKAEQTKTEFVKQAREVAKEIGLPANWISRFTSHSWRAGLATDLLSRGVAVWKVKVIGGWLSDAVLLYARVTQATMAQWSEAAQLPSSSPLLPSTFEGLASRNTPIVEGEERTGNRDFSVAMQRAAGLHAPLTGKIDETDQRTVDPFTAVPRGFC